MTALPLWKLVYWTIGGRSRQEQG